MRNLHRSLTLMALALFIGSLYPAFALAADKPDITANFKFRNIGPAVAGGRVTVVAGIPGNSKIYYVGSAGGGVWKSTDGGNTWTALDMHAGSASIGTLAIAPSNHNLIWVGTGEANVRNDTLTGAGVYFSPDAGKTWQFMGLKDAGQIARIVIDPTNPDIVFVAALGDPWGPNKTRGIYRTVDGGKHWKQVLYVDDKTGASDLVMDPGNPRVLFAGLWSVRRYPWTLVNGSKTGGIWRSTDGGDTWQQLHDGLPAKGTDTGRITLAIAPSDPNRIYALIATRNGMLWRSDDLGKHWTMVSNNHALAVRAWYFSGMAVAPDDADKVYFDSLFLMETDDGGKTAHPIDLGVHVDHHAVWVDPADPKRIIQGNDGGVFLSVNGGKTWRFLDTLPIEEAYTVSVDSQLPFHACIGLQDNSAWCGPTSSLSQGGVTGKHWFTTVGGDGEYAVIAPSDPRIVYSDLEDGYTTRYNAQTHLSRMIRPTTSYGLQNTDKTLAESKYRFNWTSPIAVSPHDADTVYIGANVLFKSTDGGKSWNVISPDLTRNDKSKQQIPGGPIYHDVSSAENYDTLLSITLAPTAPDKVIWVGTDDGLVQVTRDGGKHWKNVTPDGAPKWARVYQIGVSPFDAGTAYVSIDAHMLDNDRAYVYKTTNYGASWSRITDGLPKHTPVLVVREDPHRRGLLIAGTMTGLYYSLNDGGHWQPLTGDFPVAPVFDVKFTPQGHSLAVATHGRGLFVLDDLRPLEEWSGKVADAPVHLFSTGPGTLFNHWSDDEGQQTVYSAPNAPEGVVFDYYLKNAIKAAKDKAKSKDDKGPVKIVITDAAGHAVKTLHGAGKQGLNQVVWDMDYAAPTPLDFMHGHGEEGGGGGPQVAPGVYNATLTADGHTIKRKVAVRLDPNVDVSVADYLAGLRVALTYRNLMDATNAMLNRLTAWQNELDGIEGGLKNSQKPADKQQSTVLAAAKQLDGKIGKLKDALWNPDVQHDVGEDFLHDLPHFHGILQFSSGFGGGYGQAPSPSDIETANRLTARLKGYLQQFEQLRTGAVKTFNQQAYNAGAGTLTLGTAIHYETPQMPPAPNTAKTGG